MSIYFKDRKTGEQKEEKVAGYKFLKWIYYTRSGSMALESILKRKIFSSLYGKLQDTRFSSRQIKNFVSNLEIDMGEAKNEDISSYRTFNDFFIRELKSGSRPIILQSNILVSPADGRVFAWQNIDATKLLQVKGSYYSLADLFQDKDLALTYDKGTCIIIRLCPSDYHRFHFPDRGIPSLTSRVEGHYYSVSPLALQKIANLYCENKREFTLFQSDNFGQIVIMEVGATCVGSIVQTYVPDQHVEKGSEKGYFKFGGSTLIVFLKENTVKIDGDILSNTEQGIETMIYMGERLGAKV
ncbi:MAG: phosphatidylserine decarboxylase [Gracilibacter sp. BRH_c7a]|nr:MAG: phosphatidylserine decarboxylase [Gracilibacter sp. BRH_c7a]